MISGSFDAASGIFTFATDKFSCYAIAYKDIVKEPSALPGLAVVDVPTNNNNNNYNNYNNNNNYNYNNNHTHNYEWAADGKSHWKVCSCGAIIRKDSHTFDDEENAKNPTDDINNRTCKVCGYSEKCFVEDASTGAGAVIEKDSIELTEKDITLAITFVISAAVIGMTIIERRKVRK